MSNNTLSILFEKGGFSFSVIKDKSTIKHQEFITLKDEIEDGYKNSLREKIQQNLYLKQEYDSVNICFLTSKFNLIPKEYYLAEKDEEMWISFNTEIYEGDKILSTEVEPYNLYFLFCYPTEVENILKNHFPNCSIKSASVLFLNSISSENEDEEVFINLHHKTLEILCLKKKDLLFYNLFNVNSNNDILYYILNVYKQLGLDTNKNNLYYFGNIQDRENLLRMMLNFIRNVIPGSDNRDFIKHLTHFKNII